MQSINDHIKTLMPNLEVFDHDPSSDDKIEIKFDQSRLVPYIFTEFSNPNPSILDNNMSDVRQDSYNIIVAVVVVADEFVIARDLSGKLVRKLVGFQPVDGSQLRLRRANSFQQTQKLNLPTRFAFATYYSYQGNMTWEEGN
jgi:hypothetical protein